jgi:hypothetical protein
MSVPALARAVSEQEWLEEAACRDELVEIVDGKFVVKRVGGTHTTTWLVGWRRSSSGSGRA